MPVQRSRLNAGFPRRAQRRGGAHAAARAIGGLKAPGPRVTIPAMLRAVGALLGLAVLVTALVAGPAGAHMREPRSQPAAPASEERLAPVAAPASGPAPVTGAPATVAAPRPAGPAPGPALLQTSPSLAWVALAALVLAGVASRRRPRAAAATGLVLLLAVLAFESGVHSVHHLGDSERAQACVAAATSQHLAGVESDAIVVGHAPARREIAPVALAAPLPPSRPASPHAGRAPPALV